MSLFEFPEQGWLAIACAGYVLGTVLLYRAVTGKAFKFALTLFFLGFVAHSASLAFRWERIGHGPFINLYEILSSNIWSLMLALLLFLLFAPRYRFIARWIMPLIMMLILWLYLTPARDTLLPPTYNTVWLYFHVFSGKFFLGLLMLSTGVALSTLNQSSHQESGYDLSYLLLGYAFVCETIMLLFGAIWAQDAWGRYWAWDPLETWAFLTWFCVAVVLHWRIKRPMNRFYPWLVAGCFVLAFLTFFGVPFISTAPHKGMI